MRPRPAPRDGLSPPHLAPIDDYATFGSIDDYSTFGFIDNHSASYSIVNIVGIIVSLNRAAKILIDITIYRKSIVVLSWNSISLILWQFTRLHSIQMQ